MTSVAFDPNSAKAVERPVGTAERRGGLWGVKLDWPKLGLGILQLLAKGMEGLMKAMYAARWVVVAGMAATLGLAGCTGAPAQTQG